MAIAAVFSAVAFAVSAAQPPPRPVVQPPLGPRPIVSARPMPTLLPPPSLATHSPSPGVMPTPTFAPLIGGAPRRNLGPKIPLAMLKPLPRKTAMNTASLSGVGRRPMAATSVSEMYQTVTGCTSTIGYIFNIGCEIEFQLVYCNTNSGTAQCQNYESTLNPADTMQDYYIDANSATAQTIGSTYVPDNLGNAGQPALPSDCSSAGTCSYGPWEDLTLNNQGTVALATYDVTIGEWVGIVYISVGSVNNALEVYADAAHTTPQTQFSVPTSGTTTIYFSMTGGQYSNNYAFAIESTSVYTSCTAVIGQTPAGPSSGLCNPTSGTTAGIPSLSGNGIVNASWQIGSSTQWTSLATGTYSVIAYDQTTGTEVAQTQISLSNASSSGNVSISLVGGYNAAVNPSPYPTATPSSRFAFDNTSDGSSYYLYQTFSNLNVNDDYCFSFSDPQGRVFQDYAGSNGVKVACFYPGSSTYTETHANVTSEQPDYFAPNTYTVQACDFSIATPCQEDGSEAFQLLGYHVTTDFATSGGSPSGTALVVPKNGNSPGGLYFLNDGDTYYGVGNGDTVSAIEYSSASKGTSSGHATTFQLSSSSVTNLTGTCTSTCYGTVSDTKGNSYYAVETQHGSGNSTYTTLEICPTTWGTSCSSPTGGGSTLAVGASITIPGITFYQGAGSSTCTGGNCLGETTILPTDGQAWSNWGSSVAGDITYFTNSNNATYAYTGTFIHLGVITSGCSSSGCTSAFSGTVASPCTPTSSGTGGLGQTGFYANMTQALFDANQPFTATTGQADVYCVNFTNSSSTGTVTGIAFALPTTYGSGSTTIWSVDKQSQTGGTLCSGSSTCWAQDTTSGKCPTSGWNFCIKPVGTNPGVQVGKTETIYIDVQGLSTSSFTYGDVTEEAYNPITYDATADTSCCTNTFLDTVPVSSTAPTQTTVDSLAIASYSLNSGYMTPLFNPASEGTSTDNTVNVALKNTSTSQDNNPDYVDAVIFEFPSSSYIGSNTPSPVTSGWSYLGSVSPGIGGGSTVDYWFGVCSAQWVTADGPQLSPTTSNAKSLPLYQGAGNASGCTSTQEQSAIAPGSTFSFNTPIQTDSTAGSITSTVYAHGANTNAWSKSETFSLTETTVSADAGFYEVGTYGSPSVVSPRTTPTITTDSNVTYGNSYVYWITNTSSSGHNLTSATITVPGRTLNGGSLPTDGTAWTITSAPTMTGTTYGCTISTSSNNGSASTSGTNGTITLSGCSIPPNDSVYVSFSAKAPYTVNSYYWFPAVVNGSISATGTWTGDDDVLIDLGATIIVTVGPTTNVHGTTMSYSCPTCTITQATNSINFGSIAAPGSASGTDVALVDLYTNASSPTGWKVYVTQSNSGNPTAATYLQTQVDSTSGTGCPTGNTCYSYQPVSGTSYGTTSWTAIPVTGNASSGLVIGSTSGTSATRNPFEFANDYQIVIPAAGNTSPSTSVVTYTFISQ